MTARPPRAHTRAQTKEDGKRAKSRGATQSERPERQAKLRSATAAPTDPFEPAELLGDDVLIDEAELPSVPRLRLLVFEAPAHLAAAQAAIAAAGHVVVISATGAGGADRLCAVVREVDAVLVGLPGGEALIEAALALGPVRPVVVATWTSSAASAVRRAALAGADLATVRPHDVERLAPILLAAARLVEHRRHAAGRRRALSGDAALQGVLDELSDPEPRGFVPFDVFQKVSAGELERAERYAYPLAVAMFSVETPPPPPPPGLRGILRARAGNALVHAVRDIDVATELDHDRFLVLMPYTERLLGAEVARRIISAVAAGDPVTAAGRTFPPKVIGAVTGARRGEPLAFARLIQEATQLLEQAQATGASLAVEP
jgi:AmiR/NasT family two-component response regulator